MAPIPSADMDSEDSPLGLSFSEPFRHQSTSTQISPSPSQSPEPIHQVKCDWCGKLLMLPNDENVSEEDVLSDHINEAHPKTISFGYDGAEEGADETYDETGDLQDDDAIEEEVIVAEAAKDSEPRDEAEGEEITLEVINDGTNGTNGFGPIEVPANAPDAPAGRIDTIEWLSNPRLSYPVEYRARLNQWSKEAVKERVDKYWDVHDTALFSPDYEEDAAVCQAHWDHAFNDETKSKKREAPEPLTHILPYKKPRVDKGQFLDIHTEEINKLVKMLSNPEKFSPEELYALTETGALTLKTLQDEWLAIDALYLKANRHKRDPASYEMKKHQMTGHKKKGATPLARVPEDKHDFEEKKEAMLYGYKHIYHPNHNPFTPVRTPQNPFVQGGFVPTPAQARKMIARQKETGDRNLDRWEVLKKHGLEYIPQLHEPRKEPIAPKVTRKRKAAEVEAPTKSPESDDSQNDSADGDETEEETHPAKRRGPRPRGGKRAAAVATENYNSDTNSRRGSGRGRGRGRGRGAGRLAASRATFEVTPAPATQSSTRGRGRRGASTVASSVTPSAETTFPVVEPASAESPTEQPSAKKEALSAEAIEEARRLKIANSKNPKRTKAMLDHWDRFNREGRIRNPKRSKAQIEQDRSVDGADDSMPIPMGPVHGSVRSPSLAPLGGNLAPKGPGLPSMASVQAQQHMPPGFPPMGVSHYGHGPVNPYAPPPVPQMAQLGQPMPPQYAPFPYVQYGMGHMPNPHDPRDPRH